MYGTCVVPLDGSEFAQSALPIAEDFANSTGAGLRVVGIGRNGGELAWMFDHVHSAVADIDRPLPQVDVIINPDPVVTLLSIAADPRNVLCFATHDHGLVESRFMHAVGSEVMRRAEYPVLVTGPRTTLGYGRDVVVAIDGVNDPHLLLETASRWSEWLGARMEIVTVYEPVLSDLDHPDRFTRTIGPSIDPDEYLTRIRDDFESRAPAIVTTAALPDAVSAATGILAHLKRHPARLLVVGHEQHRAGLSTVRELLHDCETPLLVVNRPG